MWTSGLQLSLAPAKQLGNRIDAIGDVPGVAQIELFLVQPADVASPHLRLQTLRREAFRCATSLRWRQQRRQAASAVALPPALNSSHTIAQHLRCLTDPGDPLFLKKTKQSQAIGSGLVTSRFLRGLQLRNIFLDQQRISSVHTQPPVPSTSLILNRDNTLALILIPTLPIFSLCRTSRFIRIGISRPNPGLRVHDAPEGPVSAAGVVQPPWLGWNVMAISAITPAGSRIWLTKVAISPGSSVS